MSSIQEQLPYQGECFSEPKNFEFEGSGAFEGKCKVYRMAYMQGCPHVEVESYYNKGVIVYYAPTGRTFTRKKKNRNCAWNWANERKQHIEGIKANGNHHYN